MHRHAKSACCCRDACTRMHFGQGSANNECRGGLGSVHKGVAKGQQALSVGAEIHMQTCRVARGRCTSVCAQVRVLVQGCLLMHAGWPGVSA